MASKPKSGTKFACVLIFETEIHSLDEMQGVIDALEEAEQTLGDVGDCRVAGDRFLMPPDEATEPAKPSEPAKAVETAPAVPTVVPERDPMAVKMI